MDQHPHDPDPCADALLYSHTPTHIYCARQNLARGITDTIAHGADAANLRSHFRCGCLVSRPAAACQLAHSDLGTAVFECGRDYQDDCVTGYPAGRRGGSAKPGTPCLLPFRWRGIEYTECTTVDAYASCVDLPRWVVDLPFSEKGQSCPDYAENHCDIGWEGGGQGPKPWLVHGPGCPRALKRS